MESNRNVAVLDTDIGTDVDDILALALIARAPELDLIGVTTVYGDTQLRARMARYVCLQLDRSEVVVAAGERETVAGRPVWWAGHEGQGIPNLDTIAIDESRDGVSYLCDTARDHAGHLDVFAIGPLTNIARAIERDPSFASSLHHLYVMGGAFWMDKAEHNIKCDPEAADIVFRSGVPMTACGLDVTTRVWFREPDVEAISETMGELGSVLADQIRQWWAFKAASSANGNEEAANNPHDPLAVLSAIQPELFQFQECDVDVQLTDEPVGRTLLKNCGPGGAVRIASDVSVSEAEREMVRRITGQA
jgi:purine nucleosidase